MDDSPSTETPSKEESITVETDKAVVVEDNSDDNFEFEELPVNDKDKSIDAPLLSEDSQLLKTLKEKEILTIDFTDEDDLETAFNRQLEQDVDEAVTLLFDGIKKQPEAVALIKHL